MNTLKKILGYIIGFITLPVIFGLLTLDGELCYHGNCDPVIPFWGGVIQCLILYGIAAVLALIAWLVMWLIED